ncbi:MAG: FUSC family protein [Edaphocola sp.]
MTLAYLKREINKKLHWDYLDPSMGWGLRVALSVTLPLIWGAASGKESVAEWMAIAAECVSFIELKGNTGQRIRVLLAASALSVIFCIVGSLAGNIAWLTLMGMFVVGFLSGLFKNLGDRGNGLALSVYIFYIICSAYPLQTADALWARCGWVAVGALWTVLVGLFSFLFTRMGTPYRRTIADIWKAVSALAASAGKGWDGRNTRSSIRELYLKEKAVRAAIDASFAYFEEPIDQISKKQKSKYALAQSRKIASLVSQQIIAIADVAGQIERNASNRTLCMQLYSLFRALEQVGERMDIFVMTLKNEERLVVGSRIERLRKIKEQLLEANPEKDAATTAIVKRIAVLTERLATLAERSMSILSIPGEKRVYRAYSFVQTLHILHPRYFKNNIVQLFNFDTITTRYALRIGAATTAGTSIAYILTSGQGIAARFHSLSDIPVLELHQHAYWIPFTAIVVSQPYFGATLKRGIERSLGTLAGIIVGSLMLSLPFPQIARFLLVFVGSVFLIYYLRRQYSIATFFVTMMLIGLLSIDPHFDAALMTTRLICTVIGSILAISAGFLLLPSWDKDRLPLYMADAIQSGYQYFKNTFYYSEEALAWTRFKRLAESKNSNAYDSFLRFMQEPRQRKKKGYANYYYLLTHNVRVVRELNNFHIEAELDEKKIPVREKSKFYQLLNECDDLFRENLRLMKKNGNENIDDTLTKSYPEKGFVNLTPTDAQMTYIEKIAIDLRAINMGLGAINAGD